MDTLQLEEVMEREMGDAFVGVFARDQLPWDHTPLPLPSALIINLDPATQPGTHWVCFFFDDGNGEFFDSGGKSLEAYPDLYRFGVQNTDEAISWPSIRIQGTASASCGPYCCYFLTQRYSGKKMEQILDDFGRDRVKNDCLVSDWLSDRYDVETTCHPWPDIQNCKPLDE